jgi:hypothetical protein
MQGTLLIDCTEIKTNDADAYAEYEKLFVKNTGILSVQEIKNGDELNNVNRFEYLYQFRQALESTTLPNPIFQKVLRRTKRYNPNCPYDDLYVEFFLALEKEIERDQTEQYADQLGELAVIFYQNNNWALERTYHMIKGPLANTIQTHDMAEVAVRNRFIGDGFFDKLAYRLNFKNINDVTPQWLGSNMGLASNHLTHECKPQTTNLCSVRRSSAPHLNKNKSLEIRCGTQGQLIGTSARVTPILEKYASHLAKRNDQKGIVHVYFNYLPMDKRETCKYFFMKLVRDTIGFFRSETSVTEALTKFGENNPHIAVVTFPSTQGVLERTSGKQTALAVHKKFLNLALGASNDQIKDFNIPEKLEVSKQDIETSLKNAFDFYGIKDPSNSITMLTPELQQAIFFHFTRYELTNFILDKSDPLTFNKSCWDGIDRAGISATYYHLISNENLSREEFETLLHAPAALTKGRSVNEQSRLLWSVINELIKARPQYIQPWLIAWRNENALSNTPHHAFGQLKKYKDIITKECNGKCLFFSKTKLNKKLLAGELESLIESNIQTNIPFIFNVKTSDAWENLHRGRLGSVVKKLLKTGVLIFRYQGEDYKYNDTAKKFEATKFEEVRNTTRIE